MRLDIRWFWQLLQQSGLIIAPALPQRYVDTSGTLTKPFSTAQGTGWDAQICVRMKDSAKRDSAVLAMERSAEILRGISIVYFDTRKCWCVNIYRSYRRNQIQKKKKQKRTNAGSKRDWQETTFAWSNRWPRPTHATSWDALVANRKK